ncbi:DJ-1/PfpI family protein [Solobacterium moorei]|uniref:DJ-1/PfpI family protein n=1 Tax=Solobacterium moorei TaxID=102148 RepID=UPI0023F41545|nr:DJ-1/PfpI family protein [Solobacterium moorei]
MKKRIALLVYPDFSLQEVTNLMYFFRCAFDTFTDVIYTELCPVRSEEGIIVQPVKVCSEFCKEDYDCLILPGCSNLTQPIRNKKIKEFLELFANDNTFIIGAICAGPVFLAQAGLLKNKKYTASLYAEMMELFNFVEEENFLPQSVVEDENIITAVGSAFNEFAVHVARKLGYDCPDKILSGYMDSDDVNEYIHHLTEEDLLEFKKAFKEFIA